MFRKLRIALSVSLGMLALLLATLWLRSYWRYDLVSFPISKASTVRLTACSGYFAVAAAPATYLQSKGYPSPWLHATGEIKRLSLTNGAQSKLGIFWTSFPKGTGGQIIVPFWMMVLFLSVTVIAGVWTLRPLRFSLRALLVATTLVAVLLSFLAWSIRR